MKRIRVCATILGLLACAAVANAAQQLTIPGLSDAQVNAIAEGNKLVPLPPITTQNKTLNLTALGLDKIANTVNKTITVVVEQCGNKPPLVYVLLPGQTPPKAEEGCHRWNLGAYVPDSSGNWTQVAPGDTGAPYSVQITGTPAAPPPKVGEGPSLFNAKAYVNMGPWQALDLPHECVGVPGCSTSDTGFSLEAGAGLSIWAFDFQMGVFHTANVSTTVTETFTGSEGTSTSMSVEKWHVNAFEGTARANVLGIGLWGDQRIILGVQGGPMPFSIKGTSSFSGPTASGSEGFSYSGVAGWYGAHVEVPICPHLAGTFDYKHTDLRHTFAPGDKLTENINAFDFGVSISAKAIQALIEMGKAAHGK